MAKRENKGDAKAPAFQWYPKDWSSDEAVKVMTYEQRGIYRELLDHQWLEGSIPANVTHLAALLHLPLVKFRKVWPLISTKFEAVSADRLINLRLERQRAEQDEYFQGKREAGAAGGKERARRLAESKHTASKPVAVLDSASSETVAEAKPASASSSATAVDPPQTPPLRGGAVTVSTAPPTRRERDDALDSLQAWKNARVWIDQASWPECPHTPCCADEPACLGRIVQDTRVAIAQGQELALSKAAS